jgi:hypothetical protein
MLSIIKALKPVFETFDSFQPVHANNFNVLFGKNHFDAIQWASVWNSKLGFYYKGNANLYKKMVRDLGFHMTVCVTQNRDATDIAIQFEALRSNTKVWKRLVVSIEKLKAFPSTCWATGLHQIFDKALESKITSPIARPSVSIGSRMKNVSVVVENTEYKVWVPQTEADLQKIGRAMHHCVGQKQMGYGNKVRGGVSDIIVIYKTNIADGICYELCGVNSLIKQAQGRHRRPPTTIERLALNHYFQLQQFRQLAG